MPLINHKFFVAKAFITDKDTFEEDLVNEQISMDNISMIQDLFEKHPDGIENGASISLVKFYKKMITTGLLEEIEIFKIISLMSTRDGNGIAYDFPSKSFYEKTEDDDEIEDEEEVPFKKQKTASSEAMLSTPMKPTGYQTPPGKATSPVKGILKTNAFEAQTPPQEYIGSEPEDNEEDDFDIVSKDSNATTQEEENKISQSVLNKMAYLESFAVSRIGNFIRNFCFRKAKFVSNGSIEGEFIEDVKKQFYGGKHREDEWSRAINDVSTLVKVNITSRRQYVNKQVTVAMHGKLKWL